MSFADRYLSKQKDFSPRINTPPKEDLNYIVVVPCYREPQIFSTVESLRNASLSSIVLEVIVVVNSPEDDSEETTLFNESTSKKLREWAIKNNGNNFRLFVIDSPNLPRKFAGVGFARKIGMDEAISRFNQIDRKEGVLISFDADSICDSNFFSEIDKHYKRFPKTTGSTVYFEHPLKDNDFTEKNLNAISKYELHLRYFVQAMRYVGFPYAFHTVGSCFNVTAEAYIKQGGMNRRQGGEDFYFLHKIIPLGHFYEINSTRVVPSPRASDRVPFGTGPAISKIIDSEDGKYESYQFESFLEIKYFLKQIHVFYKSLNENKEINLDEFPLGIKLFLENEGVEGSLDEIYKNSSNFKNFKKRFYYWFDAFKLIKCLNFLHADFYNKNEIEIESKKLLDRKGVSIKSDSVMEILKIYRYLDRSGNWN